jgi:arabinose-5-phosphate isomerase
MAHRAFTKDHFALNHPAGSLGAKLMKVNELAHHEFPRVGSGAPLMDVLHVMTQGRLGMTTVVDEGRLTGVISDGDLRRALERLEATGGNPFSLTASDLLTPRPRTIAPDALAVEAVADMEARKITFLMVVEGDRPVGVFHLHDYLGLGVKQLRENMGTKDL